MSVKEIDVTERPADRARLPEYARSGPQEPTKRLVRAQEVDIAIGMLLALLA